MAKDIADQIVEQTEPSIFDAIEYFSKPVAREEAYRVVAQVLKTAGFSVPPMPDDDDED